MSNFCHGCTACCRGDRIELRPEEDPSKWDTVEKDGKTYIRRVGGQCVYLTDKGCATWPDQPMVCKAFRCTDFFLSLTRPERKRAEKTYPQAKAVFAAARQRIAEGMA